MSRIPITVIISIILITELSLGGTVRIQYSKQIVNDAYVINLSPGFNSSGYGTSWVTYYSSNNRIERSFIRIPIPDFISPDIASSVTSANLKLYFCNLDNDKSPFSINIHKIENIWQESSLVWANQPSFCDTIETTCVQSASQMWISFPITNLVITWISGSQMNNGVMLCPTIEGWPTQNSTAFKTSENADPTFRPVLEICSPNLPDTLIGYIPSSIAWEYSGLVGNTVSSLAISKDETIFAGTTSVWRSTNAGDSWTDSTAGLSNSKINTIAIKSKDTLFVGTEGNGFYCSLDGGYLWTQKNDGIANLNIHSIIINAIGRVFLATENGVYRSTNDGESWTRVDTGFADTVAESLCFASGGIILVGGATGQICRSTDDGNSWTFISPSQSWGIRCLLRDNSSGIIYAANTWPGVHSSTDDGMTWTMHLTNDFPTSLCINSFGHIFSDLDGVSISTDRSETWTPINNGLVNTNVHSLTVTQDGVVFAGTDNGIYRTVQYTTSMSLEHSPLPLVSHLEQNYPNPFNPVTNIFFTLKNAGFVSLRVYDILGREVGVLLNEVIQSGNHIIPFNGNQFTSGVYFYQLRTDKYMECKKMILLK